MSTSRRTWSSPSWSACRGASARRGVGASRSWALAGRGGAVLTFAVNGPRNDLQCPTCPPLPHLCGGAGRGDLGPSETRASSLGALEPLEFLPSRKVSPLPRPPPPKKKKRPPARDSRCRGTSSVACQRMPRRVLPRACSVPARQARHRARPQAVLRPARQQPWITLIGVPRGPRAVSLPCFCGSGPTPVGHRPCKSGPRGLPDGWATSSTRGAAPGQGDG